MNKGNPASSERAAHTTSEQKPGTAFISCQAITPSGRGQALNDPLQVQQVNHPVHGGIGVLWRCRIHCVHDVLDDFHHVQDVPAMYLLSFQGLGKINALIIKGVQIAVGRLAA